MLCSGLLYYSNLFGLVIVIIYLEAVLNKLVRRIFPWDYKWKGVLFESLLFAAAYVLWILFRSPDSSTRVLIGSLFIIVPFVTAALLVFGNLSRIPEYSRHAWRFLGFSLICWSVGNAIRTFFEAIRGVALPTISLADFFYFLAFPLIFYALILYPFQNRYAPTRFRFILDIMILSGVVATIGILILSRSGPSLEMLASVPRVYPIADLILLMILINMILANQKSRRTLFLWGIALLAITFSDYGYSILATIGSYQAGGVESLGWVLGGLLFGVGVVVEADSPVVEKSRRSAFDIGIRIQNILPVTFVLVLFWYVIADWQIRAQISVFGLLMSLLLLLVLIVRLGVRAGEAELHKYWQLFSSLAEPAFICDRKGKLILVNPAFARFFGSKDETQIIGRSLATIFLNQEIPADLLEQALQHGHSLEVTLRPKKAPYLLSVSPIFTEGRKTLIAGVAHNLSEQKRQQETIQHAYDELQQVHRQLEELNNQLENKVEERTRTLSRAYRKLKEQNAMLQALDQLKTDFVSMVSHELRTPLTSINGGLELLLERNRLSGNDQVTLSLMRKEVQRLTQFVENILNLSTLEAGRISVHPMPLSLPAVVEGVVNSLNSIQGSNRIEVAIPENMPQVFADEDLLQSVFNHLLDNALKYAPDKPVIVEAVIVRRKIRVQVTDSGPGIPKGKRRLLFKRFQRLDVKDSQNVYGYGLGLYISRKMLRAMQSDLAFESPPGGGARFYFHLKVAE